MKPIYPHFYKDFAQPAMVALARAGNRGVLIDTDLVRKEKEKRKLRLGAIKQELKNETNLDINPDSPKQVMGFLYKDLRLPKVIHRKRKTVTSDAEAIDKLIRNHPKHKTVLGLIKEYRSITTVIGNCLNCVLDNRGCMITGYHATGTVTGRVSSSETLDGLGTNMQNNERGELRRIFVSRPGMSFVKSDGSQAESRVVAWRARIWDLIEKFPDPLFDVHKRNAMMVYVMTEEEYQRDLVLCKEKGVDSKRQKSKHCGHAANYKGGPFTAVKNANVSYQEAKIFIRTYVGKQPELPVWWKEVEDMVCRTREMQTLWGRTRLFTDRLDESLFRSAIAFEPQSTVADLINRAFFMLDHLLKPLGAYPLIQCHDEIVVECPRGRESDVIHIMRPLFEYPMFFNGVEQPLSIPAEFGIGDNWYDLEKVA